MSVFKDLKAMHDNFGFDRKSSPSLLHIEYMRFRLKFLQEELDETRTAYYDLDLEEVIDGLIDLMVVAAGTLDLMGVDGQAHWDEVHNCNMKKEVVKNASESKRSFGQDLKKPEGWVGPNHKRILSE